MNTEMLDNLKSIWEDEDIAAFPVRGVDEEPVIVAANIDGRVMYLRGFSHPLANQRAVPQWTPFPHLATEITGYSLMVDAYLECLAFVHDVEAHALPAWMETERRASMKLAEQRA
jgi:hypothetical protein